MFVVVVVMCLFVVALLMRLVSFVSSGFSIERLDVVFDCYHLLRYQAEISSDVIKISIPKK